MISCSFSKSINIRSRVPVLLLIILNGASKSDTISWVYQNLSSRGLNDSRELVIITVSGRLLHGSVTRIINTFSLGLAWLFGECSLFRVICVIALFLEIFGIYLVPHTW